MTLPNSQLPIEPSTASPQAQRVSPFARRVCYLLMFLAVLSGWYIPGFYDWTGSDQSRPSPLIWQTALVLTICLLMFYAVLAWYHLRQRRLPRDESSSLELNTKARVTIWQLMVLTLVAAIVIALAKLGEPGPGVISASSLGFYGTLSYVAYSVRKNGRLRFLMIAQLVCLYSPFVWLAQGKGGMGSGIFLAVPGLPAILPAALFSNLMGQKTSGMIWMGLVICSLELAIGLWLARQGDKRTIAYIAFVWLIALFGSFGLNAMVRA
jgi:hypothetical protein